VRPILQATKASLDITNCALQHVYPVSVDEYDRAMEHLTTPELFFIADVNLLHTRETLADTYLITCNITLGFVMGTSATDGDDEEHRAC